VTAELHVAPDVAALLGADGLAKVKAALAHPVRCQTCRQQVVGRAPLSIVVELLTTPTLPTARVAFAHASCAPSQIIHGGDLLARLEAVDRAGGTAASFTLGVWGLFPHTVVMWEPSVAQAVRAGEEWTDLRISEALASGFTLAGGWDAYDGLPVAPGWRLHLQEPDFTIQSPQDAAELSGSLDDAPPGWLDIVRRERRCVAITGVGLGLGRPDHQQRLEAAMRGGQVVAGVVVLAAGSSQGPADGPANLGGTGDSKR
jgi:hypothetical protein